MKCIPLTRGSVAVVSDRDFPILRRFKWYCSGKRTRPYAQTWNNGSPLHMHEVIGRMKGIPRHLQVDHRNGNRLDNQRSNLRGATNQQNQMNRKVVLAASGVRGVYPNTNGRWQARIMLDQRIINLGTFDTIDEAARARQKAERKYFKSFAP